ncbi:NDP-sugar synthase [Candidatus Micrarchaeota archaeon]|nr:NDP-sugar synthase [Candidatus Micrarchaeota archaeon]
MRAIILAGGYGKRLAPLTLRLPKALVAVAGEPIISHLLHLISEAHITRAVISLNKNQKQIEEFFGDGSDFGVSVEYHYEHSESDLDKPGAVGALSELVSELGPEESFVIGGDNIVYGLDLDKMLAFHKSSRAAATLALYELSNPRLVELYGVCKTEPDGRIAAFQEKPSAKDAVSRLASTAVYVMGESFLREKLPAYVQEKKGEADRIGDLWLHYLDSEDLYGFAFSGVWGDANSPESYLETHQRVMQYQGERVDVDESASVSPDAQLVSPVVIGPDCVVEAGAVVGPFTTLGARVCLGKGAIVAKSILYDGVSLGQKTHVDASVLDQGVRLEDEARVEKHAVLGERVRLEKAARVLMGSRIWPKMNLDAQSVVRGCLSYD